MHMRHERLAEGAHGEFNPVFRAGFTHQAAYMGFHGPFLDAQLAGDLPIGLGAQK
jgi:hypothetical protein